MVSKNIQALLAVAACATLGAMGCAAHKEAAPTPAPAAAPLPSGVVGANLVSATATVKAVNQKTRMVTLRRPDGSVITFKAGDEVRNLPQVKVGDEVNVTYYESLAYEVKKPGDSAPGGAVAEGLERAKLGEKPGGAAGRVTTMTATIAAIDKAAGTVTLQAPSGETTTFKARNPDNLNRVSVGDLVNITYTEALAISVETPKK
jgi:Cu/Ag efflux protein CusF